MNRIFTKAWLLCGTLDALYATSLTVLRDGGDHGVDQRRHGDGL